MSLAASRPIVVFGDDWGRHVSSMQHLFRAIVGRRTVVWVNAIGHRVPQLTRQDIARGWQKIRAMSAPAGNGEGPLDGTGPAALVHPRVLPWHHRPLVERFNAWSLTRSIRAALESLGSTVPPVLVTGSPPSVGVVGRLGEAAAIYFCMDDFLHLPGVSARMIAPLERRLLDKVDAVVATAESLTRTKAPRSGIAQYLPQGVNFDHFATPQPAPHEVAALPRPIIGFAGGVSACCDFSLLRRLAAANPTGSVVLVGPVTTTLPDFGMNNIHLLGPRPYRDLPGYVQAFDVGIIPYLLNDWTLAVDPLKLLEYLAAGLPVVTTSIPEVHKYRDAVAIAISDDDFVALVGGALSASREEARARGQATARLHTWSSRADSFLALVDRLATGRAALRMPA